MIMGLFSFILKPHEHKTEKYLEKLQRKEYFDVLDRLGQEGVSALSSATPVRTGKTASSWTYEVNVGSGKTTICWINDNVTRDGDPIAILLQYGHGTGTGGYVVGQDYINPAIRPVFDNIADTVWKAVVEG